MILTIIRAVKNIKKADDLVKEKENFKTRVNETAEKLRGVVTFFNDHKETAQKLIEKLKGL